MSVTAVTGGSADERHGWDIGGGVLSVSAQIVQRALALWLRSGSLEALARFDTMLRSSRRELGRF